MPRIASGIGQGGVDMDKRDLANEARSLTLKECIKYLKRGKGKMYEAVLLKLAGQVLPRLTEHTGEDGKPIILQIDSDIANKNEVTSSPEIHS